jgi:anaerobic selenocysteine-containing dehydrogenase
MRTETLTFCSICPAHCASKVTVEDGKIVKWEADKESGLRYRPCTTYKALGLKEINEHPNRLKYPLKRTGVRGEGKWQRISWDEALDTIANKLTELKEKYGPQCLGASVGEPRHFEFAWLERFCSAFGTPNIRTPSGICGAAGYAADRCTYGPGHFLNGAEKPLVEGSPDKLIIIWGCAWTEKTGKFWEEHIKPCLAAGGKLVVIDPRWLVIADKADLWIKPRPGSDPVIAMGLLKVIIEEELYDKDFVDNWTVGFDQMQQEVKRFTLDDVERITWVPKEQIQQLARWYSKLQPSYIRIGMGAFGQGSTGFQGCRVLGILGVIVGPDAIPGWGVKQSRVPTVRGRQLYLLDEFPRSIEANLARQYKYAVRANYIPDLELINGILEDKIKAVLITQSEPLITFLNARKTYRAFMKVDFLVSANIFMTPTPSISDIVLPVATTNECDSIYVGTANSPPYALPKIVDPPGEARSDVMILNDLAKRLGLGEYFFDSDVESINYVLVPSGITWEELKKRRVLKPETKEIAEDGTSFFTTPSGKAEIYSTQAEESFDCNPLPRWEDVQPLYELSEEYPLFMTSYEDSDYHLSKFKEIKAFRKHKPYPTVQLNPETAQKIGAKDGDWIWIEGELGRIMQKLVVDPEIDPRLVMTTFGWYFPEDPSNACQFDKANINILLPDEPVEKATGAPDTRGTPCRVYKAEPSEVGLPEYIEGVRPV